MQSPINSSFSGPGLLHLQEPQHDARVVRQFLADRKPAFPVSLLEAGHKSSASPVFTKELMADVECVFGVHFKYLDIGFLQPVLPQLSGASRKCSSRPAASEASGVSARVQASSSASSIEPWVFMNWRRAAYYLYLAEVIDAKRALEVGLVNEVVPREEFDSRVDAIARHIAQAPMTTLLATKANLKRAWELMGMRVHWQSSNDLVALASISKDVQQLIQTVFKDKVLPSEQGARQAAAAASTDGAATT